MSASRRMTGEQAIHAVLPEPGVEMDRWEIVHAATLVAPHLKRSTLSTALQDATGKGRTELDREARPARRVRWGVYTRWAP